MKNIKNYNDFINEEINIYGNKWEIAKKFIDKYKFNPTPDQLDEFEKTYSNKNEILSQIVEKIGEDKLTDITYGYSVTPYVYFIFNDKPFTISLIDKSGTKDIYKTISIIVEVDGVTDSLGNYNIDETDKVVDVILNY
mgnify:FL=1